MLIKKLIFLFFSSLLFSFLCSFSCGAISISAESAVVINAETKEIIFEKNAFAQHSMASTTKIMTSIIAIESGRLNEVVSVDLIASEGSSIGLKEGYKLTLQSLVYGMLLESGNDAAEATAEFFSGNEERFSDLMNKKARQIGMQNTNFVTASGLDADEHYSTAYDMALLGAYAIKNPIFRKICSDSEETVSFIEPNTKAYFSNHNKLLGYCDGVFGIKTGFTKKSGRCLVTACERGGVALVAVTLGAPDDWNDHEKLYNECFSLLKTENIAFKIPEKIKVYGSLTENVSLDIREKNYLYSYIDKGEIAIRTHIPEINYAPIKSGDVLGAVRVYLNDEVIYSVPITAKTNAVQLQGKAEKDKSFFEKLKEIFFT